MFKKRFWLESLERALKSAAQFVVLGLGLGEGLNAFNVDWQLGAGFAIGGFVISILTSIASAPIGDSASPSLLK